MAKMFYSAEEAAERLGRKVVDLKSLVREGKLREFRDGDSINYKVADVDAVAAEQGDTASLSDEDSALGEIVLEPAEDSAVELAPTGSDILSLDELEADATSAGTKGGSTGLADGKEGSAIPSVGINVFDDDELDEQVDPLAQTAVTDVAGMGMEGTGSGSGILDLTRESDDTSLGQELLDEIYTGDQAQQDEATVEMGDDTRAGLDEALPRGSTEEEEEAEAVYEDADEEPAAAQPQVVVTQVVEYTADALSSGLTALLVVAAIVMWFGGLAAVSLAGGTTPALVDWLHSNLLVFTGAAIVVGVAAAAAVFFMAKRGR